jgi:hypothetical protein
MNCSNSMTGLLTSLQHDHDFMPSWKNYIPIRPTSGEFIISSSTSSTACNGTRRKGEEDSREGSQRTGEPGWYEHEPDGLFDGSKVVPQP